MIKKNAGYLFFALTISAQSSWAAVLPVDINLKAAKIASKGVNLKPSVLKLGIDAFLNTKKLGIHTREPIITLIDYSLPSSEKRLWVIDLKQDKILYTSMVAHGKNSGSHYTTKFSNQVGSLKTSLGVFLTAQTYFGRDGYSLKVKGLERGFNDNAESRYIVLHGANYVSKKYLLSKGRTGRSWGCPAVENHLAKPIIDTIKDGTLIVSFYPDRKWLSKSKFVANNTKV
jgi:L,D-transpeptidase catalytic domain.